MRRFRKLYSEVEFSLRNILTNDQIEMIQNGTLDVGFLRLPVGEIKGVDITAVHTERLVVVLPLNHALARSQEVRLQDLRGEHFVMYERAYAPGFHDFLTGIFSRAGLVPEISQTAGEMSTLISLVDSGMGVAVLPASAAKQSQCQDRHLFDKGPYSSVRDRDDRSETECCSSRSKLL
jgi:DNA-binding transcriptional LysR family regulator